MQMEFPDLEAFEAYLRQEITPMDLAQLIDSHRDDMVQHLARLGEPWTADQASMHFHLGRWRDLLIELSNAEPGSEDPS